MNEENIIYLTNLPDLQGSSTETANLPDLFKRYDASKLVWGFVPKYSNFVVYGEKFKLLGDTLWWRMLELVEDYNSLTPATQQEFERQIKARVELAIQASEAQTQELRSILL